MNVEDSYEGAIQRLRRLGHAGINLSPPVPLSQQLDEANQRLRDVEELATLACDDNERLNRELDGARAEIARLQREVSMLQESVASTQYQEAFAATKRGSGAAWLFAILVIGAATAAAFVLRPWEHVRATSAVVAAPEPAPAPVVTAPPPVVTAPPPVVTAPPPVVTAPAAIPKAMPTIPKAAPMIPKAAPVVAAPSPRHHSSKHHASKRARREEKQHSAATHATKKAAVGDTDDPLGGVNL